MPLAQQKATALEQIQTLNVTVSDSVPENPTETPPEQQPTPPIETPPANPMPPVETPSI